MQVKLVAQNISASVASALEFLENDINISDFHGAAPTVKFKLIIDQLFDMSNSRNP